MYQLILILHVIVAIAIIGLVLIQQGKGSDIGAAFGSGASNTVFGSQGSTSFLLKLTGTLAAVFFTTSLTLGIIAAHNVKQVQQFSLPTKMSQPVTAPAPTPQPDKKQ